MNAKIFVIAAMSALSLSSAAAGDAANLLI